jgi:hypothetical protein
MDQFDAEPSNTLYFGKNAAIGTIVKRKGAHLWYDEKLDTWIITDSSSYAISPILLDTDPNATQIMNLTALQPNVGFLCPPPVNRLDTRAKNTIGFPTRSHLLVCSTTLDTLFF